MIPSYEGSAAWAMVHLINHRLPDAWERLHDGDGMWRWERADEETYDHWIVAVNAREDRVLVPCHGWPEKVGPTVLAARFGDPFATVTLPWMSDNSDRRRALAILSVVVPDLAEGQKLIEEEKRRG